MNILITEEGKYPEKALEQLRSFGSVTTKRMLQSELGDVISDIDVLIVGLGLNINKEVIDKGTKLKLIATATTGSDHVDVEYAKSKGIEFISLKGEGEEFLQCVTATSELAFGLILSIIRHIPAAAESVNKYEWDRESYNGSELDGKTLGLVGLGRLGKHMARYGNAFNMNVISHDPYISEDVFVNANVSSVSMEDLFKKSDIVSIHVVLSSETENLISSKELGLMQSSAILVNTSRGKIVDESAILDSLQKNKIAGYATDVLANEVDYHENFTTDPLVEHAREHKNCLIVPHIGGMAVEAAWKTRQFITDKVVCKLKAL